MNNLNPTFEPQKWVLLEVNDINGDSYNRVLAYFRSRHNHRDSWRLSEPVTKKKQNLNDVEYTDRQGDTYVCDYRNEGLNEFLGEKYDRIEHEQRRLFLRQVRMLPQGENK